MLKRISKVNDLFVNSVSYSSIVQLGDSSVTTLNSKAIAVQREYPLFFTNEAEFDAYPIFNRMLEAPPTSLPVPTIYRVNEKPTINVGYVHVTGVSSSSMLHVGTTNTVNAEVRIKHIRQLLDKDESNSGVTVNSPSQG